MKRNESMANQTRFEILMEEIKEYIWDAKDKVDAIHVAAVARKLYLHGTVKGKNQIRIGLITIRQNLSMSGEKSFMILLKIIN